jgi:hypothetical protein
MIRLSDSRIAFRFESGEFSGPFVAELEANGGVTLWPLTNAAWSIGSLSPESVVTAYYKVATDGFDLPAPGATDCRTTNDPVDSRILASNEIQMLVAAGVLLPRDEPEALFDTLERQEYLDRRTAEAHRQRPVASYLTPPR